MNEHDYEPVPGLPAPLPKGESILWQGAPCWRTFARRAMHVRLLTGYFIILAIWDVAGGLAAGMPVPEVAISTFRLAGLAVVAIALLTLFAWLVAGTTFYTVTNRRVVMRFGIALPITIQISFRMIESAGAHVSPDGTGDIAMSLVPGQRIAFLVLWPHVRPWKFAKAQPTLRGIPDADAVAQLLGRALAASASQPPKAIKIAVTEMESANAHVSAAA